jgi:hypothetical protein
MGLRRSRLLGFGLSVGGYLFACLILFIALVSGIVGWTGDVGRLFDPVGDAFRAGLPVYVRGVETPFFYAPPWVLLFGVLAWLPIPVQVVLIWAANIAALRYMAGSWLRVGWLAWFPLIPLSLLGATLNLAMAGAIVAAVRGGTVLPVAFALAKVSPILAIDPKRWRQVLVVALGLVAITLPWLSLWPAWVGQLAAYAGQSVGPVVPVPLIPRLAVALPLMALRRPWARALAAAVAIPSFYWESFVVLLAPLCVLLFHAQDAERVTDRRAAREADG